MRITVIVELDAREAVGVERVGAATVRVPNGGPQLIAAKRASAATHPAAWAGRITPLVAARVLAAGTGLPYLLVLRNGRPVDDDLLACTRPEEP